VKRALLLAAGMIGACLALYAGLLWATGRRVW
jgi:hypothetical protein